MRSSSVDFQFTPAFDGENQIDAHYTAVFKGFIHPLGSGPNRTAVKLYLVAAAAQASLYVSTTDDPELRVTTALCSPLLLTLLLFKLLKLPVVSDFRALLK